MTGTTTNLTTGLVTVNGSPAPLPLSVTVQGFENVIGSNFADSITGNAANNSLSGGAGNDSYGFDADLALGTDTLNEAGGGIDTLDFSATTTRSIAVNLGLATSQVVNANLSLTLGSATTIENVIGGGLADTLTGNALANSLIGGGGNDTLIGGAGADRFRFDTALNATTNRDVISDFSIAQGDTIELENAVFTALTTTGTLVASAFFIGAAATTATQRILYNNATGSLLYDSDGIGAIGSIAFATLTTGLALNNTSFTIT
jgi:Ca2+-binding RTX toxin-like protein